jgi:hypothetical protein
MPATKLLPCGRVNRLGYVDASVCEPRDKSHVRLPRILVMGCCSSLRSRATLRPGARGQLRAESYEPLQSVRGSLFVVSRILRRRRRLVLCLRFVSRLVFLRGSLPLVTLTHLSECDVSARVVFARSNQPPTSCTRANVGSRSCRIEGRPQQSSHYSRRTGIAVAVLSQSLAF